MTLYELLFLTLFFIAIATLLIAAVAALRGRGADALRLLRRLALGAAVYLAIVSIAALVSTRRVLPVGELQCYDDWCIAVDRVQRTPQQNDIIYEVDLRLASRAKRIAQREKGLAVYASDASGQKYEAVPEGSGGQIDALLQAGESVPLTRVFRIPAAARDVAIVFDHGRFPGCLIIGESCLPQKEPIVRLDR